MTAKPPWGHHDVDAAAGAAPGRSTTRRAGCTRVASMGRNGSRHQRKLAARRLHHHRHASQRCRGRHRHQPDLGSRQARACQADRRRATAVRRARQRAARVERGLRALRCRQSAAARRDECRSRRLPAGRRGTRLASLAGAARVARQGRAARGLPPFPAGRVGAGRRVPRFRCRDTGRARRARMVGAGRCAGDPPRRLSHAELPAGSCRRTRSRARRLACSRSVAARLSRLQPARCVAPERAHVAPRTRTRGRRPHRAGRARRLRRPARAGLRGSVAHQRLGRARLVAGARTRTG